MGRLAPHGGCNWEGCEECFPAWSKPVKAKKTAEPSITLVELEKLAEKFNREPWTFPTIAQKSWLDGFVKSVIREVNERDS